MFSQKNICQSCMIPLTKDPKRGGTNADGSISTLYCSYCYSNGTFTEPHATVGDMIQKVQNIMKTKLGIPRIFHWLVDRWCKNSIPKLKRWNSTQ